MRTSRDDQQVFVGAFPDFHDPTVLFWGSSAGLKRFAKWLHDLSLKQAGGMDLADLAWIRVVRGTEVRLELTAHGSGMQPAGTGDPPRFRWAISPDDARRFGLLIESVAASENPGHHYLDSQDENEFVVIVSKGEYDGLEIEIVRAE